jgi:uncharacterized RDD family membrane protein YckC
MELLDKSFDEEADSIARSLKYPSFGRRWAANIIDVFIILSVFLLLFLTIYVLGALGLMRAFVSSVQTGEVESTAYWLIAFIVGLGPLFILITWVIYWLYYAYFESKKGGTLGKLWLGLRVTDLNGNRLTFGKASLRLLARFVCGFTFYIGHVLARFTKKKQALHDIMAGTLVVKYQKQ